MSEAVIPEVNSADVVLHHLELFGLGEEAFTGARRALILADELDVTTHNLITAGAVAIAFDPSSILLNRLMVSFTERRFLTKQDLRYVNTASIENRKILRTFHSFSVFEGSTLQPVVMTEEGGMVWSWLPRGEGGILLVGTNLSADLVRLRQGNPSKALERPGDPMWGIAGERPNYLFDQQMDGLPRHARPADEWCEVLASFIATKLGCRRRPLLPGGAPGAVVITGDDDQAYLEKYAEQLKLLGNTPITYFLHPLTRHTPATLTSMLGKSSIDLGIHPDALESPRDYARVLKEQCAWFERLVGKRASSLRNHGFLNDGYWGHLKPWVDEGISFSSNIPGLDGCAVNGSLLPARVYDKGYLTGHWSVVTAIGDGVRYVNGGKSDVESANCIFDLADAIRQSAIPGVMVLNFHPQNVGDTRAMHLAAREVIRSGFIAWNMRDCLDWFANGVASTPTGSFRRTLGRILPSNWSNALFQSAGGYGAGAKKNKKA